MKNPSRGEAVSDQPSRLEATLNLACAAMTILFCGQLTAEQRQQLIDPATGIVPLRDEFSDVFAQHAHMNQRFHHLVAPDLGSPPYYYSHHSLVSNRVRVLFRINQMPSVVLEALRREIGPAWKDLCRLNGPRNVCAIRDACAVLKFDSRDAAFLANQQIDLDAAWHRLRAELQKMREDAQ